MPSSGKKHHRKPKDPVRSAIIDLCVVVLVAGAGYFGYTYYHDHKVQNNNEAIQVMYRGEATEKPGASIADDQLERLNRLRADYGFSTPRAGIEVEEVATEVPTEEPTAAPTVVPTDAPTETPAPMNAPTEAPAVVPTDAPTETPAPANAPTEAPTEAPDRVARSVTPTPTAAFTMLPTEAPTEASTEAPAETPTEAPTVALIVVPAAAFTEAPADDPTEAPTDTSEATEAPTQAPTEEPSPRLNPSFTELYETNHDVIGWITTGGNVDYPVVWREDDNDFYLTHDFNGDRDIVGTIFLDKRNQPDFSDDLLLVYGHNMRSGSMFGDLNAYRDVDYLTAHPIVTLQNAYEEAPRQYVLFSLFDASMNADDRNYFGITYFNFANADERQAYLDALAMRSMYAIPPVGVGTDDQLVTLVTCSYSNDNGRFLLTGRALREGETEESILEMYKGWKGK